MTKYIKTKKSNSNRINNEEEEEEMMQHYMESTDNGSRRRRRRRDAFGKKLATSAFLLCIALLFICALLFSSHSCHDYNGNDFQNHNDLTEQQQQQRFLLSNESQPDYSHSSCDLLYSNTNNDKSQQCLYAHQCNEYDGIFLPIVFCSPNYSTVTLCLLLALPLLLLLLTLFRLIVSTAEDFFSPPLEMFSVELGLPHRFAGVTLLALGNGAPDVSATVNAMLDDHNMGYQFSLGELTGSGMFISSVIVGAVVLTSTSETGVSWSPALIRDVIVFFVSHVVVFADLGKGVVGAGTVVAFFVLYFSYVLIVLAADLFHGRVVQPRLDKRLMICRDRSMSMSSHGGDKLEGGGDGDVEDTNSDEEEDVDDILGLGKMKKKNIVSDVVDSTEKGGYSTTLLQDENQETEENDIEKATTTTSTTTTTTKKKTPLLCNIERKTSSNLTVEEPITHNQFESIMELLSNYSDVQYSHQHQHQHHTHQYHRHSLPYHYHPSTNVSHLQQQHVSTGMMSSGALGGGGDETGSAAAMTTASTTSSTSGWAIEDEYGTEQHIAVYHGPHSLIHVNRSSHSFSESTSTTTGEGGGGFHSAPTSPFYQEKNVRRVDTIPEVCSLDETTSEHSALLHKQQQQQQQQHSLNDKSSSSNSNETPTNIYCIKQSYTIPDSTTTTTSKIPSTKISVPTTISKPTTSSDTEILPTCSSSLIPPSSWAQAWEQNVSDLQKHFKGVWDDVYSNDENHWFEKLLLTCELPFTVFRMLTIPIPCGGYYCRCLVAISTMLSPLWITVYVWDQDGVNFYEISSGDDSDGDDENNGTINYAIVFTVACVIIGLAVFRYAPGGDGPMPIYFSAPLALYGFIVAATWIDAIADYLVSLLSFVGIICRIPSTIMGLTVLAVGNSMGDLSANVTMSRKGLANMAVTACFAGPVFNILIGLGLGFSMLKKVTGREEIHVELTSTLNVGFIFLIVNCVLVMVFGLIFGRGGRIPRKFGYLAITVYTAYVIASLCV